MGTSDDRVLILSDKVANPELTNILTEAGIDFHQEHVYETEYQGAGTIDPEDYDLITFTSASCVEGFVQAVKQGSDLSKIQAICIGEQTAKKAREHKMQVEVSDRATISSMVALSGGKANA